MSSAAPEPPAVEARTPTWGLGDVAIGLLASLFLSGITLAIVDAATGATDIDDVSLGWLVVAQTGLWIGLLGTAAIAARVKGNGLVRDFHLRATGHDLWFGGLLGALLQIPVLPLLYAPFLELLDKSTSDLEGPARELTDRANDPFGVLMLVLIVGLGAPVVEEIFWRGLMQRSMFKIGAPPWIAIGVTAIAFGAIHLQPLQFPALALFGALAGWLAWRYDRLGPAIAAHVAFNMVTVIALLVE